MKEVHRETWVPVTFIGCASAGAWDFAPTSLLAGHTVV